MELNPPFCHEMRILGVVKKIRKVFKFAFGEENLHSILDGNGVNGSECFLDLFKGDIKIVFKTIHRRFESGGSKFKVLYIIGLGAI